MTPSLSGRIQTRLLLLTIVGVPVTLLVAALLGGVTLAGGLAVLAVMAVLGVAWELLYHLLQQRRWDKDWPSILALVVGVPEALVAWQVLGAWDARPDSAVAYSLLFGIVWTAVWLALQGPMRVLAPRWRFHGMQLVRPSSQPAAVADKVASAPRPVAPNPFARWVLVSAAFAVIAGLAAVWITRDADSPPPAPAADVAPHEKTVEHDTEERPKPARTQVVHRWDTAKRVKPTELSVPAFGHHGRLTPIGLSSSGALETPPASSAGWYQQGVAPGQKGPAVIVGDMSTGGVFSGMQSVAPHSRIEVTRRDGVRVRFDVDRVQRVAFASFPTARVYADTQRPTLRLIGFDSQAQENVIVFATASSVTSTTGG